MVTNKQTNKQKKPGCQCGRCKIHGFDPWIGKIWRRKWQRISVYLSEKFHEQRKTDVLQSMDCKESDATKRLRMHAYILLYVVYIYS